MGDGGGSSSRGGITCGDAGRQRGAGGGCNRARPQHRGSDREKQTVVGRGNGEVLVRRSLGSALLGRAAAAASPRLCEIAFCRCSEAVSCRWAAGTAKPWREESLPGGVGLSAERRTAASSESVQCSDSACDAASLPRCGVGLCECPPTGSGRKMGGVCASEGSELSVRPVESEMERLSEAAMPASRVATRSMSWLVQLMRWMGMGADEEGVGVVVVVVVAVVATDAVAVVTTGLSLAAGPTFVRDGVR